MFHVWMAPRWECDKSMSGQIKEPQQAVIDAIESGRLSTRPKALNYAGDYTYIKTSSDGDVFIHNLTGRDLPGPHSATKEGNS